MYHEHEHIVYIDVWWFILVWNNSEYVWCYKNITNIWGQMLAIIALSSFELVYGSIVKFTRDMLQVTDRQAITKLYTVNHQHVVNKQQIADKLSHQVHHQHAGSCWQTITYSCIKFTTDMLQVQRSHQVVSRRLLQGTGRSGDEHLLQRSMPSLQIFSETCTWHKRHKTCDKHSCL